MNGISENFQRGLPIVQIFGGKQCNVKKVKISPDRGGGGMDGGGGEVSRCVPKFNMRHGNKRHATFGSFSHQSHQLRISQSLDLVV